MGLTGVRRKPVLQPVVDTVSDYINTVLEKQNFQNVLEEIVGFAVDVSLLTDWILKYAVQAVSIEGRWCFHSTKYYCLCRGNSYQRTPDANSKEKHEEIG